MTLKDYIDTLIEKNRDIREFIVKANHSSDADQVLIDYADYLNKSNYNSALGLSFAFVLQFASDPTLSEQFELRDIEKLYDSLIELNYKCSDIYIDAASFANSALDNKDKAKEIIDIGIDILTTQLGELEELKKDLNP